MIYNYDKRQTFFRNTRPYSTQPLNAFDASHKEEIEKRKKDRWLIKPLQLAGKFEKTKVCAMDVETMNLGDNTPY